MLPVAARRLNSSGEWRPMVQTLHWACVHRPGVQFQYAKGFPLSGSRGSWELKGREKSAALPPPHLQPILISYLDGMLWPLPPPHTPGQSPIQTAQ